MFKTMQRIHFIGIGGAGMSGIAEVLANLGYQITGSDIKKTPVIEKLTQLGIPIALGHDAAHVGNAQGVVISSAIHKHNPEIIEAQNRRIPIIHRSEMLAELMRLKYGIVVAGTHGKTTTTSMIATVLSGLNLDPTVVIGGKLNSYGSSAKHGNGELFLAEADESDGSFLRLHPAIAVITNIDRDHLDHYGSLDKIVGAFEEFIDKIPFYGAVIACFDDPMVQMILPKVRRKLLTYGLRRDADVTATEIKLQGFETTFTPVVLGRSLPPVTLKMPGNYNITNALASFALCAALELDLTKISDCLSHFEGVLHRFTPLGVVGNCIVIDDYAHNPKKIETVLKGTKESFPEKQIIAIFQPHRYSRIKLQLEEFTKCFSNADKLIITPIYSAGEQPLTDISQEVILHKIKMGSFNNMSNTVFNAANFNEAADLAIQQIKNVTNDNAIIMTLGAGDVRQVGNMIVEKLKLE